MPDIQGIEDLKERCKRIEIRVLKLEEDMKAKAEKKAEKDAPKAG